MASERVHTRAAIVDLLARPRSLFAGLPANDLAHVAASLQPRRFGRGQVIFLQDQPGSTLYLIESGDVKLSLTSPDGREIVLANLGAGDLFGELALLEGAAHQSDAVAKGPSELWLLDRADFVDILQARPGIAIQLLGLVVQRLRRSTQIAYDVAFLDVPARLARVLLELASEQDGQIALTSKPTQSQLAAMLGATRESVNKWLGTFERIGLIRTEREAIVLVRPDDLRRRII